MPGGVPPREGAAPDIFSAVTGPATAPAGRPPRLRRLLPLVSALLLAGAFWVLYRELTVHHPRDIWRAIASLPARRILLALLLTGISYLMLPGYDALAQRYVRHSVGVRRTWLTGFIAYAFSQTLGFALLTGGSIRYRLYSGWGLSVREIAQIIAFAGLTYWLGVLTLGGAMLAVAPADAAGVFDFPFWAIRGLGLGLLALPLGYLAATRLRRTPVQVLGLRIEPAPTHLALAQIVLGCVDWTVAASVLYVLLPLGAVPFAALIAVFVIAQAAGVLSHVPAGLGVFESVVVLAFKGELTAADVLGSLVVFRVVYHLIPLLTATLLLLLHEGRQRR